MTLNLIIYSNYANRFDFTIDWADLERVIERDFLIQK